MPQLDLSDPGNIIRALIAAWGLKVIGALAVLVIGHWVARWLRTVSRRAFERSGFDATLAPFLANIIYSGLFVLILVSAAAVVGINTTAFIAVLGAAGLAVALAFQSTLSNFAAGVMLLVFRPFKAGDFVEAAGVAGTVREIGVFMSTLATPDNVEITVPNAEISGAIIKNYSANETRRLDLVVGVSYDDDLNLAVDTARRVIETDARVLADPAPVVAVHELADSSVNLVVRPWVKAGDYWTARWDLTKALKETLERAGCTIPYPQHDVHVIQEKPVAA